VVVLPLTQESQVAAAAAVDLTTLPVPLQVAKASQEERVAKAAEVAVVLGQSVDQLQGQILVLEATVVSDMVVLRSLSFLTASNTEAAVVAAQQLLQAKIMQEVSHIQAVAMVGVPTVILQVLARMEPMAQEAVVAVVVTTITVVHNTLAEREVRAL
jgi:hypothetical protein